ncbi:hypothetical protein Pint_12210 [Pistacia integerrima]|uniref:Uncharacterized protein n=1 Tax=Pistacia integerrima TaxID=434235 RepID=A0ACC0XL99_9ROSI|nr:hypothetical protein Pint_12210 [Pistacia integerrima]
MATTDVNSIPDPQDAIIEMAQINIDSTEAPQAPNEIMNGSSTQSKLHKAALKGDWETAKYLLEQDNLICQYNNRTPNSSSYCNSSKKNFVKELVNRMEQEELSLKDKNGNTAFCFAAAAGVVEIAKIILTKNSSLMTIRGAENVTPLYMAALFAQRDMASFLYGKDDTKKALTVEDRKAIFFTYIRTGFYDLALNLLKDHPELAVARDMNCDTALHVLARMPSTFARKDRGLLEGLISSSKLGNFEFLAELIGCYPDFAYELDNNNHTIFHEVEQIAQPSFREKKNSEAKTPQEIFSEEHERLLRSGELWMKKTAESCMLVATLITTIMFVTALSVPGG